MAELKIKNWCAYQERSQNETRYKLLEYGITNEEADLLIVKLIGENFLNEQRFSIAFAGGKLRIKHWGKNKIKQELKKHKVSEYCINQAFRAIDGEVYEKILLQVIEKKLSALKAPVMSKPDSGSGHLRKQKNFYATLKYAVSRGFESDLVTEQLNILLNK